MSRFATHDVDSGAIAPPQPIFRSVSVPVPTTEPAPDTGIIAPTIAELPLAPPGRLVSLDAYRGLVMVLMLSAGLGIGRVVTGFDATPGWGQLKTPFWEQLA